MDCFRERGLPPSTEILGELDGMEQRSGLTKVPIFVPSRLSAPGSPWTSYENLVHFSPVFPLPDLRMVREAMSVNQTLERPLLKVRFKKHCRFKSRLSYFVYIFHTVIFIIQTVMAYLCDFGFLLIKSELLQDSRSWLVGEWFIEWVQELDCFSKATTKKNQRLHERLTSLQRRHYPAWLPLNSLN